MAPVAGDKGIVEIAAEKGSIGKVTLSDAGSTLTGSELAVGGTAAAAGGSGSLSIGAGTTAGFSTATIWQTAAVSDQTAAVSDAGTLDIGGAVAGNGNLQIESGGRIDLGGSDKTVGIVFAAGADETLALASAKSFEAAINGFAEHDTIDLPGISVTGKTFSHDILTLSDGATLKFVGSYSLGDFHFSENVQGTDITFRTARRAGAADLPSDGTVDRRCTAGPLAEGISTPVGQQLAFSNAALHVLLGFD